MSNDIEADLKYDPNSNYISINSIPNPNLIANANWNNSWAIGAGTSVGDSGEYAAPQRYELKDVNGNKFIIDMTDQKVEKIKELSYRTSKFSKKFPFVKFEKKKYTKITVSKKMGDKESFMIKVDCNLSVLMKLLGLEYNSWAKGVMNECVKHGSIQN